MAQKKKSAQRAPRAAEPRMYGDGHPSQTAQAAPTTAAAAEPAVRTAGATPRASSRASASGSYARVDKITDYSYVKADLRRLGITAAGILAILVVLGIVLP
jgi:hypothetical protein